MSAAPATPEPAPRKAAPAPERISAIVHFLPSLTDLVFLLPFFLMLKDDKGLSLLLRDSDTGWHLRTGEWILQHGRVPVVDMFSFTKAGQPWFAWEWLWDVAFGWLHLHAGLAGVAMASLTVIALAFAITFRTALRRSTNLLIVFGITMLGVIVSTMHWHARPHLFTLLFTGLFCAILDRVRSGNVRLLWLLPPLTILWTNLHGAFFVGSILLCGLAAGEICGWVVEGDRGLANERLHRSWPYLLAAAGCGAASFVNPYGYQLHLHIFRYLFLEKHADQIQEFQSMGFHGLDGALFGVLLLVAVISAIWHFVRREFGPSFLLLGWSALALYSMRHIPIFALVMMPLAADAIQQMLRRADLSAVSEWVRRPVRSFLDLESEFGKMDRHWRTYLVSVVGLCLLLAWCFAPNPPDKLRARFDPRRFPVAAVNASIAGLSEARIFVHDQWGGYLIYRMYPRLRVFTDGRSDFYGPAFLDEWEGIRSGAYDWKKRLDKYAIDTVLLPAGASLASTLKESRRWRVAYDDGVAIVFRKPPEVGGTAPVR